MLKKLNIRKHISANSRYAALLLLFFLLSYIIPLGSRDLIAPDETRYAVIPYEMINSGNWTVPYFNGLRYFEKPVMGYWIQAYSLLMFGNNNFAVRFPSALAALLSAVLICVLVRRVFRCKNDDDGTEDGWVFPSVMAAFIFLSCFEVFAIGNIAVLDGLFSFFTTASVSAFYFASEERPGSAREKCILLLAGILSGFAFMTKGFSAFMIPVLSITAFLMWQHRYSDIIRMGWLPLASAIIVVLPWAAAIHSREPDYWNFFFWNEHIRRFMANNAQHKESFWFFFAAAPALFFPWTFLVPATVSGIKNSLYISEKQKNLLKLCICWLVFPFLFFSFSSGKLLTYVLPCFAPFAVLMSIGITHALREKRSIKALQAGIAFSTSLLSVLLIAFLYIQLLGPKTARPYADCLKPAMISAGILFSISCCILSYKNTDAKNKIIFYSIAPLLFFFLAHYAIPESVTGESSPYALMRQYKNDIKGYSVVISDEDSTGAVCWYLKTDNTYIIGDPGEFSYGLKYNDAKNRLLDQYSAAALIASNKGRTLMVTKNWNAKRLRNKLPNPFFQRSGSGSGFTISIY